LKTKTFSSALKNAVAYNTAGVAAVNSKVEGLAPVFFSKLLFIYADVHMYICKYIGM
jgi:hypothetical protein